MLGEGVSKVRHFVRLPLILRQQFFLAVESVNPMMTSGRSRQDVQRQKKIMFRLSKPLREAGNLAASA
jgi:hypothetical protein